MTNDQFLQEMSGLLEAFPALKNRYKLNRIFNFCQDLTPDILCVIISKVGDEAKQTPSINDFKTEISKFRRDYYAKHGRYWGQQEIAAQAKEFDCKKCIDSGIVEVCKQHTSEIEFLMRCDCDQGKNSAAKLPFVANELKNGFTFKAPDLENFKPTQSTYGELKKKADAWFEKIKNYEQHFSSLGYKHDS